MSNKNFNYQNEFPYLSNCKDFNKIQACASYDEMQQIEEAIKLYLETDKIQADDTGELYHVDGEFVPLTVIQWYCGSMETSDFISEYFDDVKPSLSDQIRSAAARASEPRTEDNALSQETTPER